MKGKDDTHFFGISIIVCVVGLVLIAQEVSLSLGVAHLVVGGGLLLFSLYRGIRSVVTNRVQFLPFLVSLSCFVAILSVARFFNVQGDFSEGGKYSLSEGTKRALATLDTDIDLYRIDIGEVTKIERENTLLERFESGSSHLTVHHIDPVYDISLLEKFHLQAADRLVVVRSNAEPIRLKDISEQSVTTAIHRIASQKNLTVLYSIGHGEPRLESTGPFGVSRMYDLLKAEGMTVTEYSLLQSGAPQDTSALFLMVAPEKSLSPEEEQSLQQFVDQGGNILLATEGTTPLPQVFQREGVEIAPTAALRVLRSPDGEDQFSYDLPVTIYRKHPATVFLAGNASVLFSRAYPLRITGGKSARMKSRSELLRYGNGKKSMVKKGAPQSLILGVVLEGVQGGRLEVVSDSSWVRNRLIAKVYNEDFLRGSLLWGSGVDAISLPQESSSSQQRVVTVSPSQVKNLLSLFLLLGEGLLFIAMIVLWWRRRQAFRSRQAV